MVNQGIDEIIRIYLDEHGLTQGVTPNVTRTGNVYKGHSADGHTFIANDAFSVVNQTINADYDYYSAAAITLGPGSFDFSNNSLNLLAKSNVWISGMGKDLTTLLNTAITNTGAATTNNLYFSNLTVNANSNKGNAMNLQKVSYWGMQNVKLQNSSNSFVLNWSNSDRLVADRCEFIDGGLTGSADNCAGGQIKTNQNESMFLNCYFNKTSSLGGGMLTTGGTGNLLVDGCVFVDDSTNSYAAVSIEGPSTTSKEVRILNSRAYGASQGFQIGVSGTTSIDYGEISNCVSTGTQLIQKTTDAIISNGRIINSVYGFYMLNNTAAKIASCIAQNTNITSSATKTDKGGIYGKDNAYFSIRGFSCYDLQGSPTTPYGIYVTQTSGGTNEVYIEDAELTGVYDVGAASLLNCLYVDWEGGKLVGTLALTGTTTFRPHNINGYVSQNSGTGTIANGATNSGNIAHGLSYTPTAAEFIINFTENPTNTAGTVWLSGIDATNFVVNCENDPGASGLDFSWSVRKI